METDTGMQASLDKFVFPRLARRLVISHNIKPNSAVSVNARSGVINAITTNTQICHKNTQTSAFLVKEQRGKLQILTYTDVYFSCRMSFTRQNASEFPQSLYLNL